MGPPYKLGFLVFHLFPFAWRDGGRGHLSGGEPIINSQTIFCCIGRRRLSENSFRVFSIRYSGRVLDPDIRGSPNRKLRQATRFFFFFSFRLTDFFKFQESTVHVTTTTQSKSGPSTLEK